MKKLYRFIFVVLVLFSFVFAFGQTKQKVKSTYIPPKPDFITDCVCNSNTSPTATTPVRLGGIENYEYIRNRIYEEGDRLGLINEEILMVNFVVSKSGTLCSYKMQTNNTNQKLTKIVKSLMTEITFEKLRYSNTEKPISYCIKLGFRFIPQSGNRYLKSKK